MIVAAAVTGAGRQRAQRIGYVNAVIATIHATASETAIRPAPSTSTAHHSDRAPGYYKLDEYTVVQYENLVTNETGEVTRAKHGGIAIESVKRQTTRAAR